jgi:hypothetical protein
MLSRQGLAAAIIPSNARPFASAFGSEHRLRLHLGCTLLRRIFVGDAGQEFRLQRVLEEREHGERVLRSTPGLLGEVQAVLAKLLI